MIQYFRERSTLQAPAFLILAVLLKIWFVDQPFMPQLWKHDGGLITEWLNKLGQDGSSRVLLNSAAMVFLTGSALYTNHLAVEIRMFNRRQMMVAMSILLLTSMFPRLHAQWPAIFALPVALAAFAQITSLYLAEKPKGAIFNAGLLSGLAYLLYHPFLWILPACFVGMAFMRAFRPGEWLLLLISMATPVYFTLSIDFLTGQWNPGRLMPNFFSTQNPLPHAFTGWLAAGTALFWGILGFFSWQKQTLRMVIQGRKNWYFWLFLGISILPGFFLTAASREGLLVLFCFPAGSLFANVFTADTKGVAQLWLFWLIIAVIGFITWSNFNGMPF